MTLDPDITSINIVDANGQIVPYFTFQTVDGLRLPIGEASTTPVPEPGSVTLLGSALLGFGVVRRRRKRVYEKSTPADRGATR